MQAIADALKECSTEEQVAALLYLGWTHEEIATATNTSKGTVQNRRDEIEAGELKPPREVFDIIRSRERNIHRVVRDHGAPLDTQGDLVADFSTAIAELEALGMGPDGETSLDDLVGFATLVAHQSDGNDPKDVVNQVGKITDLVKDFPGNPEAVHYQLKVLRGEFEGIQLGQMVNDNIEDQFQRDKIDFDHPIPMESNYNPPDDGGFTDESHLLHWDDFIDEPTEPYKSRRDTTCDDWVELTVEDQDECLQMGGDYDESTNTCCVEPKPQDMWKRTE